MILSQKFSTLWLICYIFFHGNFNQVLSAVTSCRAKLTGVSGTFTSPHYPREDSSIEGLEDYFLSRPRQEKFIKCQWEITVPEGKGIQLKFGDFDISAPLDECDKGEVDVFSGTGKLKSRLDKYCAGNHPDTVTSLNNTATVVFKRPINFAGRGFLISFIAITPRETITDFITCSDAGYNYTQVESYSITCPGGCANISYHPVIGKLPYREDSHICRAAVHAGAISDAFGGRVTVKRESGKSLYRGSTANNITTTTGPMADYQINFPSVKTCHDQIEMRSSQLSASSYLNVTNFYGRFEIWLPGKGLLSYPDQAWSPGNVTRPQWLQVDLKTLMNITGIITKGSSNPYTFTKSFSIKYSYNNITWHPYKEEGCSKTKVFGGNKNAFSEVRNNFVRPTIVARYVRLYPTILVDKDLPKQGIKLALTGCDIDEGEIYIDDIPPPPPPPTISTTTSATTTTAAPTSPPSSTLNNIFVDRTTTPEAAIIVENVPTTNATNLTDGALIPNIDETADKVPGVNGTDLSERSIIIIGIVAALAVTSILLATLVLVLVRKRKKDPKHDTSIPKLTSQSNATYHAAVGMPYAPHNNNEGNGKQNKKKRKNRGGSRNDKENLPLNGHTIENSFTPDGVTLQYDQQCRQPLRNGAENGSEAPIRASYSINKAAGTSKFHPANDDTCSFTTDDDDHEYQVILDPICDYNEQLLASKASTGSSLGTQSKNSDLRQQEAVWGRAGDAWSRESTPEKRQMTSFIPSKDANSPPSFDSGSFSQQSDFSTNKGDSNPFSTPNSASAKPNLSSPKHFLRSNSRGHPAQNPSSFAYGSSYQRFSSSSTGSSAHSKSDGSSILRRNPSANPSTPYYSSVPPETKTFSTNREPEFVFSSSTPHHPSGAKHPPQLSNNNNIYPPVFSPVTNGSLQRGESKKSNFSGDGSNSVKIPSQPGKSLYDHVNSRNDYDQLYRKKTPSDGISVAAITSNNYDQLNLNTPV